jgi:hypothetical protein
MRQATSWTAEICVRKWTRDFSLLHSLQVSSETHPVSYPIGTGCPPPPHLLVCTFIMLPHTDNGRSKKIPRKIHRKCEENDIRTNFTEDIEMQVSKNIKIIDFLDIVCRRF